MRIKIRLPGEIDGKYLADAIENAARSLQNCEVRKYSRVGYKPGSVLEYECLRLIDVHLRRSKLRKFLRPFEMPILSVGIDRDKKYTEIEPGISWDKPFSEVKSTVETFVAELYRRLGHSTEAP